MKNSAATINRALFTRKVFESASLGVLASVFHRLAEPGEYTLHVDSGLGGVQRIPVQVVRENAPRQVSIDLARLGVSGEGCGCQDQGGRVLLAGGVLCCFVSSGGREFKLRITRGGEKGTLTLLDTARALPAGDLFATTLVRPGTYRASIAGTRHALDIRVDLPKAKQGFNPRQGEKIPVGAAGFGRQRVQILSGQSLAFVLEQEASVRVELVKPDHADDEALSYKPKRRNEGG